VIVFDVGHVFRTFGGPRGLLTVLENYEQSDGELNYNTVQMWAQRNTIPTKWMGAVIYCIDQEGHACREFLADTDEFSVVPYDRARR
jgi:hypothetical protein